VWVRKKKTLVDLAIESAKPSLITAFTAAAAPTTKLAPFVFTDEADGASLGEMNLRQYFHYLESQYLKATGRTPNTLWIHLKDWGQLLQESPRAYTKGDFAHQVEGLYVEQGEYKYCGCCVRFLAESFQTSGVSMFLGRFEEVWSEARDKHNRVLSVQFDNGSKVGSPAATVAKPPIFKTLTGVKPKKKAKVAKAKKVVVAPPKKVTSVSMLPGRRLAL
jgi:hypothetical protein